MQSACRPERVKKVSREQVVKAGRVACPDVPRSSPKGTCLAENLAV